MEEVKKSETPLVTIITPSWNRPKGLARSIECVDKQTYENWEHIIVHDGEELMVAEQTPRRQEICLGKNYNDLGVTPINEALNLASGKYYMILADDNEIAPDHVESLVKLMESDEGLAFSYSFCIYMSHHNKQVIARFNSQVPRIGAIDLGQLFFRRDVDKQLGDWIYTRYEYDADRVDQMMNLRMRFENTGNYSFTFWHGYSE